MDRLVKGVGLMVSLMFDSDDPVVLEDNLFFNARVATYADLMTPDLVARFAGRLVVIDRGHGDPMNLAFMADIEPGALSVEAGAAAVKRWAAEGRAHIGAYCDRNDWDAVNQACLPIRPHMWIATLDGTLNPNGKFPSVVQFAGEAKIGLHVDVSVVYDENWFPLPGSVNPQQLASVRADAAHLETLATLLSQDVARL